jgi:dicarboxylate/amino acid:cation (Na+ or H+) symporter, DAACS family
LSTPQTSKGIPLHTKILFGLLIGATLGGLANYLVSIGAAAPGTIDSINTYIADPAGQIFLRLLIMIVIPLIFASIALGVAGLGDLRRVGRVGGKTLVYFLLTTTMSAAVGLTLVQVIQPGTRVSPEVRAELLETYAEDAAERVAAAERTSFGVHTFVNIVTRNPIRSAVEMDLLGVIFFSLLFGAALTLITAERARPMISVLEALNDIVIKIVEIAMKLAPYGVAALIFGVTSRFGFALLQTLSVYVGVVLLALFLHVAVTISLILRFAVGISPLRFFLRVRAAIVTAFSTSSSAATLPTAIATTEQNLGVPGRVAGFVLPLGATMNMNGTSIFEAVTIIFLCEVFGVSLTFGQQVIVVIMSVITAVGAAGVPGGSIPLLIGILAMFGVPGEGIALILGVDRILDMSRTTVNVIGDMGAAAFIAKSEGLWDPSMIPEFEAGAGALDDSPGWPEGEPNPPGERPKVDRH